MKKVDASLCRTQILVCTNERPQPKACCKVVGGQDFYDRLKARLKETGLNRNVWATRTGCLGNCNTVGTTVVIHSKGQEPEWYSEVTADEFNTIWEKLEKLT